MYLKKYHIVLYLLVLYTISYTQDNKTILWGSLPAKIDHYSVSLDSAFIDTIFSESIPRIIDRFKESELFCNLETCDILIINRFLDTIRYNTVLSPSWMPDDGSIYISYDFSSYITPFHKNTFKFTNTCSEGNHHKYVLYSDRAIIKDNYLIFKVIIHQTPYGRACKTYGELYYIVIEDWLLNTNFDILDYNEVLFSDIPIVLNK